MELYNSTELRSIFFLVSLNIINKFKTKIYNYAPRLPPALQCGIVTDDFIFLPSFLPRTVDYIDKDEMRSRIFFNISSVNLSHS